MAIPVLKKADITESLARMARPSNGFDARRYFRGDDRLQFYNVGTKAMRTFARSIYKAHRAYWSVDDAMSLADELIADPYLETKAVGIELLWSYRRAFKPTFLAR